MAGFKVDLFKLREIISHFTQAKILVVGDLMLDQFEWGRVSRISPEAPIPVVSVSSETSVPGGAANVAVNLSSLGADVYLSGVVGEDIEAGILKRELRARNVSVGGLIVDKLRLTTLKRRIIADGQQVVRMDREVGTEIRPVIAWKILNYCKSVLSGINGIIISDYGKGVITKKLARELQKFRKKGLPVAVDPKTNHFDRYKWVSVITPNRCEVEQYQHVVIENEKVLVREGKNLLRVLGCEAILITRGEEGMSLFEKNGSVTHIPTVAREVYDVTGAGDTVTGAITLSLACGASMREAAVISNYAAGVVVGKRGTGTVSREELLNMLGTNEDR